jgi:hypothetical protein
MALQEVQIAKIGLADHTLPTDGVMLVDTTVRPTFKES